MMQSDKKQNIRTKTAARRQVKMPKRAGKPHAKPVSLYGIPFEEVVEGLLKTPPPEKKKRKTK